MTTFLRISFLLLIAVVFHDNVFAQLNNNCVNAVNVCNNQLAEQLDDGPGTQECPSGGCGCMLSGEKNTRWFRITVATAGTLEFTLRPYNGTADYDFSVWNQGVGGTCPTGSRLSTPDRCNFASPQAPTGIRGTSGNNSEPASGNLFSNNMSVSVGQVIYILVDNYDGTQEGFYLDFFGGTPGSGTGTTATFSCTSVNQCTSCNDADCKSYYFASPDDYTYDETAANGACHSNFGYATVKTATVCGNFTVPAPFTSVQFPTNRGYEIVTTNGANTTTCLNSAVITYQVWDNCASAALTPVSPGIYSGLNNVTTYKVCKTITVTGTDCWLNRICLPFWTIVPNDVICSATPLTVNAAAVSGTTAGAASDLDAGCTGYQDVYYRFVAPASGRVQINVTPNASSDVKVSVIGPMAGLDEGVNDCNLSCSALGESNVVAGCNDEAGVSGVERLFAFVVPGQTYYVWVSGTYSRPSATFTIQVTETITSNAIPAPGPDIVGAPDPIPSNDLCSNATSLNLCVAVTANNIGATAECTDPDPEYVDALTLENDVWYKWTAPANNGNSEITLTVTGVSCTSGVDGSNGIQFGIFSGSCASLTPISQGTYSVTFTPVSGQTYYFVIDGDAGANCTFTIELKRPRVTAQTCAGGSVCSGDPLGASMTIQYYGSNPGTRWAYCKSGVYGSACTINLDDPTTYFVYNPVQGLPDPGCTPATYTFVGYILADNGQTSIPGYPSYPLPQPATAGCTRQTNACTFNIYPDLDNYITVVANGCQQTVTKSGSCPAALTLTGNTNQTVAQGTVGGNFTAVTVSWASPYNTGAPACASRTIQTPIFCPAPTSTNACQARPLTIGGAALASNNVVAYQSYEQIACGSSNSAGYGVWFSFIAPVSGNVDILLTGVGSGNDLDAQIYWISSREAADMPDCDADGDVYSDYCSDCNDMLDDCNILDHGGWCSDDFGVNANETLQMRGLWPDEKYYIMIDGFESGTSSRWTGNFSIQVVDAGSGPTRPTNDECSSAIDLSNIGCGEIPGSNVYGTSKCSADPIFTGATTENSVWYTYVPSFTGPHTIRYLNATGYDCMGHLSQTLFEEPFSSGGAGIQFTMYTSSTNDCNGTFTEVSGSVVSTGQVNGQVTVNLTEGQKYYIMIDGFAGNECTYKFQIDNPLCCVADLGAVEKGDTVLCFGERTTLGVSADPILFGSNAEDNPVIAWQFSTTQPTGASLDPFHSSNSGKGYFPGQIDITTPGTSYNDTIRVFKENIVRSPSNGYTSASYGYNETPITKDIVISGFPTGATLQNTSNMKVCVYFGFEDMGSIDVTLTNPAGDVIDLFTDVCNEASGGLSVCFSSGAATTIGASCTPAGGVPQSGALNDELKGDFRPEGNFSTFVGDLLNGTWRLTINDDDADFEGFWFFGWTLDLSYTQTLTGPPVVGTHHGDYTIINNDPFKYGPQQFWLTPVTMVDYNTSTGTFTKDTTCYDYGPPVKITLLERVTTPLVTPVCAAPGDGSNGISLTVTSPTGGLPGLPGAPVSSTLNFSNNTALAIPDNNTTWNNRDITVSGFDPTATLTSNANITACLTFNPEHTYVSDIDAQLIAPNGGILQLTPGSGSNGNDLNGQYCFAISGTVLLEAGTSSGGNLNTGTYDWSGNYNNINNSLLNGLWRLQIRDNGSGDAGTLASWSLSLTGLAPAAPTNFYTVTGTGAASGISFPSPPVGESEVSNSFNVGDGQAWNVRFVDTEGCESEIGGNYNRPNPGTVVLDTNVCDGVVVPFTTSNPIPKFSQYRVILDFDSYPQDVSWFIYDGNNAVVASGGGYGTTVGANTYTTPATIDPNNGPYKFVLYDGFDDGFGSGGGSSNNGGSTSVNFIKIQEIHADGTIDTLFSQYYGFCTSLYCVGPISSVFGLKEVDLGTPTGTFTAGVTVTLENNRTCTGTTVAGAITLNSDGTGTINTNAAGILPGNSYSIQYTYADQYGCTKTICGPLDVFPAVSIAPAVSCVTPPTVNTNPSCVGCVAPYDIEYSYNGGYTWTTDSVGIFQDPYIYAHVINTVTGVIGCEDTSYKLGDCSGVLPIELLSLEAKPMMNKYIDVLWVTGVEVNTKSFEVLRSSDGVHFAPIGNVTAAGHSTQPVHYSFSDKQVQPGVLYYYRLNEIDLDGKTYLTKIVSAELIPEHFEWISLHPNPATEITTLTMFSAEQITIELSILNDLGQQITTANYDLKKGMNELAISCHGLAKGTYYIVVKNNESVVTKQLIKL
ncbi:MAG: proprotein convertase P-domain-containing protein [Chitinophagales bacterium]|nr:proprotein convertase P-domain-containing protein [Chitinophagales bacterium]